MADDGSPPTMARKSALERLCTYVDECAGWSEKCGQDDWASLLKVRSIDYKGDEVRVAKRFRWENLVGALPDEVGKIPLEKVCELGTLAYVNQFEDYLLPIEAQVYTKAPTVMVEEDSWEQVCSELLGEESVPSFLYLKYITLRVSHSLMVFSVSPRMNLRMDGRFTVSS